MADIEFTNTPITFTTTELAEAARQAPDLVQQRVDALVSRLLDDGSYDALLGASLFASEASPELRAKVREAVDAYLHRAALYGWH